MEVRRRIVVDGSQNSTLDRIGHRRTGFDDESVKREMLRRPTADFTAQNLIQIESPLVDGLTGPAVDKVETDILEPRPPGRRDRSRDVFGLVQPAEHP